MNLIFGIHSVASLLTHSPERIKKLIVDNKRQDARLQDLLKQAKQQQIAIEFIDKQKIEKIAGNAVHQGIIAECTPRKKLSESDLETLLDQLITSPLLLILDEVQDPHNLGACLRTADAAGVTAVIAPKDNSVGITAVVEKVASGAAETIPFIQVTNLARTIRSLKERNIWIYGLADSVEGTIYQADFKGSIALVLGAEGPGLRQNTLKQCDVIYSIPMAGSVSSLNVSAAAAVCLFEAVRQRL